MRIEFSELIRQDISIWDKIEKGLAMFFLHLDNVLAKVILASDLIARWEMIDLLILI